MIETMQTQELNSFPGGDLVIKGLADLSQRIISDEALLVSVASPRLRALGFVVPELTEVPLPHEHALFEAMERRLDRGAHAAYNALIGRIVSFAQAYEAVNP